MKGEEERLVASFLTFWLSPGDMGGCEVGGFAGGIRLSAPGI